MSSSPGAMWLGEEPEGSACQGWLLLPLPCTGRARLCCSGDEAACTVLLRSMLVCRERMK